jgi:hypothetical protein
MVEELWIFKRKCWVGSFWLVPRRQGTHSINPNWVGCNPGYTKPKPDKQGPLSATISVFRWKMKMDELGSWKNNVWTELSAARLIVNQAQLRLRRFNASALQRSATRSRRVYPVHYTPRYNQHTAHTMPSASKKKERSAERELARGPRPPVSPLFFPSSLLLLRQRRMANWAEQSYKHKIKCTEGFLTFKQWPLNG